jgi:ABC-type nitrate/sulfonate/bicarbonate transport system permease component
MDLKINKTYITLSVIAFLLIFWQFSYSIFNFSENIIPPPTKLVMVFIQLIANGELLMHSLSSLQRVLIGFSVAAIIGVGLGLLCASINNLRYVINPIVEILRPIPPIAWIPLAIILLGLGDISAYFIVFLGAFFPIFTNTFFGAASLPEKYKNISKSLELSKISYLKNILFKYSLPNIFTGLRIGIGMAWMSVIAAEMIGAQSGLGYFIQMNRLTLGIDKVIIGMLTIGLIGFILYKLINILEKISIPWSENDKNQ